MAVTYTFPNGFSIYTHNASASNAFANIQGLQGITYIWGVNPSDTSDIRPYIPGSNFNPSWLTAFVPGSSYQVESNGTASISLSGSYPGITRRVFASGVTGTLGYAYLSMPINSLALDLRIATVTRTSDSAVVPLSSITTTIWTPIVQGSGAYRGWLSFNGNSAFNNSLFGGTSLLPNSSYYIDFGSSTGNYVLNIPRRNSYLIANNGDFITTNNGNYIVVQQGL